MTSSRPPRATPSLWIPLAAIAAGCAPVLVGAATHSVGAVLAAVLVLLALVVLGKIIGFFLKPWRGPVGH